jgi:uncharacterized LabA/DUF88 family protein
MSDDKTLVIIDGSNTYFKIKSTYPTRMSHLDIDYPKLIAAKTGVNTIDLDIRYCIGKIRVNKKSKDIEKSMKLRSSQQKLFAALAKQGLSVITGFLLEDINGFREKGVDVRMAADIICSAYEKSHTGIIILSSDTDLIPAINIAKSKGITTTYLGFAIQPSIALTKTCTKTVLISQLDIENCLANVTQKQYSKSGVSK